MMDNSAQPSIDSQQASDLIKNIKLPPQPGVLASINKEIQRDEPSFDVITQYVMRDAALAARVLKVVNSPAFSGGQKIDSISWAIARLGLKNFYTVILSSCFKEAMGGGHPALEDLWEHTDTVAQLCRDIAKQHKGTDPEHAYMAGLFHDAAFPILVEQSPEFIAVLKLVTHGGSPIQEFESQHLGTHHATVGYMISKSWGLPAPVSEAIQFHHADDLNIFTTATGRKIGSILILADHLVRFDHAPRCGEAPEDCPYWAGLCDQICEELNIFDDNLEDYWMLAREIAGL